MRTRPENEGSQRIFPTSQHRRPVHTYSIVARDPSSGEMGVAVQSHWFSVGSIVSWAEAGVGAIATQSFVDPSYGPRGLQLMRLGASAARTLESLLAVDEGREVRQVAMVDSEGRVASHTGPRSIASAGHQVGDGYGVQANMMRSDRIVPSMAEAFEASEGRLARRLVATLRAAEETGGDLRGSQSAAIVVVGGARTGRPWEDRRLDLRVEDHPDPVRELERLLTLREAYDRMNEGDAAMERGDMERALAEYTAASQELPDNIEIVFWNAFTLATNGQLKRAQPLFSRVFEADASWSELLSRLPDAGLITQAQVDEILTRNEDGP